MNVIRFRQLYIAMCVPILAGSLILGRRDLGAFVQVPARPVAKIIQPALLPELHPVAQSNSHRLLRDLNLQAARSFKVTLNAPPGRIIHTTHNTLLVLDLNDSTVKEYSESGNLLRKYSSGEDELPAKIVDFTVSNDGMVWTAEPNGDVLGITADGSISYRLKGLHPMRLAWLQDRLLVQTVPSPALPFGNRLFVAVSAEGRILGRFGELVADNAHAGLAVTGRPVSEPNTDGFIYAPTAVGLLASYTSEGTLRFLVKTIEPLPLHELDLAPSGAIHAPPIDPGGTFDVSLYHGMTFILSSIVTRSDNGQVSSGSIVDVYDSNTGSYKYSFPFPLDTRVLCVWNQTIYAARRNVLYEFVASDHL